MSEWKEYTLREICTDISYGFTASANDKPVGPKFLRITDIVKERIDWDTVPFCSIDENNKRRYKLDVGDIVIARTGATTGYTAIIKENRDVVFASYLIRYKINREIANPFYIDFLLRTYQWKGFVDNIIGGSAQPGANAQQFADFEFALPPLPEQRAIASILSSLDDKIDLLHRQNKTLEALAETLFRQLFVVETEGLETKTLDELIIFDPREKISKGTEYSFFDMKCLSESSMMISEGIKRTINSGSSFRNGDTLLAKITPCLENGKTAFVMNLEENELARGSTEFIVMRAEDGVSPYFVYCLARYADFRNMAILSMTGTSGRQRVQTSVLKNYEIKYSKELMGQFHQFCHPNFIKIEQNQIQIRTLTRLRDTLLPRLMSGEIRVKLEQQEAGI